jgi:rhamnosyltransferase
VDEKSSQDARVVGLPYGMRFGGAAKNFFRLIKDVDVSRFDYISLSDQDDIWLSEKLSSAIGIMKKNGSDAYSGNVIAFWPDGRQRLIDKAQPQRKWDYLFEAAGPGCTYVFTRKFSIALKNTLVSKWDSIQNVMLHDWFFYAFARNNGYRWTIDKKPHMLYRQHETNQVGVNIGIRAAKSRIRIFVDNIWLKQGFLIHGIVGGGRTPFFPMTGALKRRHILILLLNSWECRRRIKDRIAFFFLCLVLAVRGGES